MPKTPFVELTLDRKLFKNRVLILIKSNTKNILPINQNRPDLMSTSNAALGEIKIKLDGVSVKNHSIDAEDLGNFLINFQGLMSKFSKPVSTNKKWQAQEIKSKSRLYLKKLNEGSVDLILTGTPQMPLNEIHHIKDTYNEVVSTADLINKNPTKAREVLNERFSEPKKRLEVEQKLKNIYGDKMIIGLLKEKNDFVFLNSKRGREIDAWLTEDYNQSTDTVEGIVERLKGDGDKRYFTIRMKNKRFAKCYYNPEIEPILKDYFKRQPIIVKGLVDHKVKGITIEKVIDLKAWKEVRLDKLGKFSFKKHLDFGLDYADDLWFIESKDFGIRGCGKYYDSALNDLEDSINEAVLIYVKKGDPAKMTEKAKELREKLIKLIK